MRQIIPRLIVKRRKLGQRRGTKLRMLRQNPDDLGRVEITDHALTAPPVVTVTILRNEVPPESHLRRERRTKLVHQILAPSRLGRFVNVTRALVRVTIESAGRRRIVSVKIPFGEMDRRTIEQLIEKRAIV